MGPDADLVASRFARGSRCFAVLVGGGVGGYGWLSRGPEWIGELQLEIHPRPDEGYVWNCATIPEHRRQGIFRSLLVGISRFAREDQLRRLWIGSIDIPAERAVAPAGFRPALRITSVNAAGMHAMRIASVDPGLAAEARSVLTSGLRPVSSGFLLRRSRPRRH